MATMRRFIDVIFVEPKHRQYIVLHQGEFWQLPRMNLSVNAWQLKKPYTGSLDDIFLTHSQAVGEELADVLSTYELPEQLAGLPATHFLAWWATNDYKWLSQKGVVQFDDTDELSSPAPTTATTSPQPVATPSQAVPVAPVAKPQPPKAPQQAVITPAPQPQPPTPTATTAQPAVKPQPTPQAQPQPTAQAPQPATATPVAQPKPQPPKANTGDVFDHLLDDLLGDVNEELIHQHH